jgi:signal transduction histidine kinase
MRTPRGSASFPHVRISRASLRAPVVGYGWVRVLPLLGAVTSVGLLHIPELEPSWVDWVLALAAALLVLAGGMRPLTVTLAQSVLLVVATATTTIGAGVTQILTAVALGELAFRRRGRPLWLGVAVVTVATALAYFPLYSVSANVLRTLELVGLPLLLGSYLRSQRDLAWQAEQRATEAARAEVARELHDVVAHHVAAIVLRVGVARHVAAADPRTAEVLDDVHGIASEALTDLRGLVSVLRDPAAGDQPGLLTATDLTTALDAVVDRTRQAGVDVDTDIDADAVSHLDVAHRHAVLRVVQEGLTNVLKHAGTGVRARLAITRRPDDGRVEIVVRDTGGTAPRPPGPPGHGLTVMRERVELLHGSLTAGATATGWRLHAALPEAGS